MNLHHEACTTPALTYQDTVRLKIYTMLPNANENVAQYQSTLFYIHCRKLVAFTCTSCKSNVFENKRRDCRWVFHVYCTYTHQLEVVHSQSVMVLLSVLVYLHALSIRLFKTCYPVITMIWRYCVFGYCVLTTSIYMKKIKLMCQSKQYL